MAVAPQDRDMTAAMRAAASGRNVLIAFALVMLTGLSFGFYFTPAYQAVSNGLVPFDMQFPLSEQNIAIQIALLTPASLTAYTRFMIVDFVSPPLGAVFWVLAWAWLLNRLRWAWFDQLFAGGFWLLPVMAAGADLAENVFFHRIVAAAPTMIPEAVATALTMHDAKLRLLLMTTGVTALLTLLTLCAWAWRRMTRA
jgi:hypothetical protein